MSRGRPRRGSGSSAAGAGAAAIPRSGRVLSVDLGTVRIGVALSDSAQRLASPLVTLSRPADLPAVLDRLVRAEKAVGIVIGLPLSLDGSVGPAARSVLDELEHLAPAAAVPVVTHDERLTTVAATGDLQRSGRRGRDARRVVDQAAAAVLLQSWLDRRSGGGT